MSSIIPDSEEDVEDGFPKVFMGDAFAGERDVASLVKRGMTSLKENHRDGRIYASQAAVCQRQATLTSTNNETEIQGAAETAYYALGNTVEDLVMSALTRQRALLFTQYKLPDVNLNMGGYIDGIIHVDGRIRVLEVKSCGDLPAKPKLEHRAQALVYSAITGLPPTILYFSRKVAGFNGDLYVREFALTPTAEELMSIVYMVAYAREAIDREVIPEIPPEFTNEHHCGYCPWKQMCWHGQPLPRPVVDVEMHLDMVKSAQKVAKHLMKKENVQHRRNGVLQHVRKYGTPDAKKLLAGDWSGLI